MGILGRLGKIFQAEAHSTLDKIEDPVKMAEQGLRDLRSQLQKAIEALAHVKAQAIRTKNQVLNYKAQADSYQQKAVALLKKAQDGLLDQVQAERLAGEALRKKNEILQQYQTSLQAYQQYQAQVEKLEATVNDLKQNITKWENEVRMLKARASVAKVTKKVNKELTNLDYSGTINMLERMKEKIENEEAVAQAYAELSSTDNKSIDSEINKALGTTDADVANELEALKAQLSGQLPPTDSPKELSE